MAVGPALSGSRFPDWGGFDWIRNCGAALVMALGTAAAWCCSIRGGERRWARGNVAGHAGAGGGDGFTRRSGAGLSRFRSCLFSAAGDWKTGRPGGCPTLSPVAGYRSTPPAVARRRPPHEVRPQQQRSGRSCASRYRCRVDKRPRPGARLAADLDVGGASKARLAPWRSALAEVSAPFHRSIAWGGVAHGVCRSGVL